MDQSLQQTVMVHRLAASLRQHIQTCQSGGLEKVRKRGGRVNIQGEPAHDLKLYFTPQTMFWNIGFGLKVAQNSCMATRIMWFCLECRF